MQGCDCYKAGNEANQEKETMGTDLGTAMGNSGFRETEIREHFWYLKYHQFLDSIKMPG